MASKKVRVGFDTTHATRKVFKKALKVLDLTAKEVFQKAMEDTIKKGIAW